MGRGKLSLNLIGNPKSRISTFKKRKNNLMKKAYELSTLCDVPVCVLIHGPDDDDDDHHRLHTWPPNRTHVQALLRASAKNPNFHKRKTFDLSDFFEDRRAKLLAETCKICQHQFLCPNPNPSPSPSPNLDCFSESELRAFMESLDSKLEAASAMLDLMEPNQPLPFPPFSPQDDDTPLLQSPFIEDDQFGLSFEDLQSLFPEHHHDHILNNILQFDHHTNSINHHSHLFDNANLIMPAPNDGHFELEFGNTNLIMPPGNDVFDSNDDLQHLSMMPGNEFLEFEFEFGNNNLMMPGNDFFHW